MQTCVPGRSRNSSSCRSRLTFHSPRSSWTGRTGRSRISRWSNTTGNSRSSYSTWRTWNVQSLSAVIFSPSTTYSAGRINTLRALILFIQTLALYKSFTYLLTYLPYSPILRHSSTALQSRKSNDNRNGHYRRWSWVKFGGRHFARKYICEKLTKMFEFLHDICPKSNKVHEFYMIFAQKWLNFTWCLPPNSRIFRDICPKNIFPKFGGHVPPP